MKKILFITGTRADYGKIKSILQLLEKNNDFEIYIFVCGMHLLEKYGGTYREILKDKYKNVIIANKKIVTNNMAENVSTLIHSLNVWLNNNTIDLIVVHGDRTDALAGAIVGSLNNIRVAHIEGGEISGTIDESLRHAISKLSNFHFVTDKIAQNRLIQMGEDKNNIFIIGSPDIDLMFSSTLPSLKQVKERYDISFDKYSIILFHPVTTEYKLIKTQIKNLIKATVDSNINYIVIYPNNDLGNEFIINEYKKLKLKRFKVFPSIRFEYFLTLLKNSDFIIGNSSCGVRESCIYGISTIDIGTRQTGRYSNNKDNIFHSSYDEDDIYNSINYVLNKKNNKMNESNFKKGNSSKLFLNVIQKKSFWGKKIQKKFIDLD